MKKPRSHLKSIARRSARLEARTPTTTVDWQRAIPSVSHDSLYDIVHTIGTGLAVSGWHLRPDDKFDEELLLDDGIFFRVEDRSRESVADAIESKYKVRPSGNWIGLFDVVVETTELVALPRVPIRPICSGDIDFEIDLSFFKESRPLFAYVDDYGRPPKMLQGLEICGSITIEDQPKFMWLEGPRLCTLFTICSQVPAGEFVCFGTGGGGEFCLEIYHIAVDRTAELLFKNDYFAK